MQPRITLSASGINGGFPGGNGGKNGVRGKVTGWSKASARSNERFLRSVDVEALPGELIFFTLTVGVMPPTGTEWARLRARLKDFINDQLKAEHWHHVTEWQERGVPHLHGVICGRDMPADACRQLRRYWLGLTAHLSSGRRGQHIEVSRGGLAFFVYMARHASRGVDHYQRTIDAMPEGWEGTGRMWGKSRDWPTIESTRPVPAEVFYRIRRLVDRARVSRIKTGIKRAVAYGDADRAKSLRASYVALRRHIGGNGDRAQSSYRGIDQWLRYDFDKLYAWAFDVGTKGWAVDHVDGSGVASFRSRGGLVVDVPVPADVPCRLRGAECECAEGRCIAREAVGSDEWRSRVSIGRATGR